ncbi:MAG: hypothetical protein RIR26_2393 [Pseudomonadota bacterium]
MLKSVGIFLLSTSFLATTVACQTVTGDVTSNDRSSKNESNLTKEPIQEKSTQEWQKSIDQLTHGPLSDTDADFAFLLAQNFINQKQLEPALKLMKAVFNSHPSLVSGIELVRLVTLNGDLAEAEQITRKLQLFYPKSTEPALAQSYIAQLKGSRAEAEEILSKAYKSNPTDEEVAIRYINLLIESGEKNKAKGVLNRAISTMPQSPFFLLRLARLKSEEKQYKEAKNLLDKLLKLSPDNIEAWTLAGFIASEENNTEAAERYFREAYEKQPENDTLARYYVTQLLKTKKYHEARRLLLRLEASAEGDNQFDPELTFQLAYVLYQLDEYAEAKKRFLQLVDKSSEKERLYFFAGQCEEHLKNNAEAIRLYQSVAGTSEIARAAKQRVIQIKIEDGQFIESESLLRDYSESYLAKPSEDDFKFLAASHAKMGQFAKAQAYAESGLQKFPGQVDLLYLKAAYMEHTISRLASIAALEKIIASHPDHVQTLNHLGYTLGEANLKLDFALSLIEKATQKEPKNGFYLDSLGWLHFKLKRFSDAEKYLNRALKLEPNEPVIHEHLGELKLSTGEPDQALRHFENAMSLLEKVPQWRLMTDFEWNLSKARVEKRVQQLRNQALPQGTK